jgi:hypothetical protein
MPLASLAPGISVGDTLQWNGSAWVSTTPPSSSSSSSSFTAGNGIAIYPNLLNGSLQIANTGCLSVAGTTGQTTVSNSNGAYTVNLAQDLSTSSSSVQFNSLKCNSSIKTNSILPSTTGSDITICNAATFNQYGALKLPYGSQTACSLYFPSGGSTGLYSAGSGQIGFSCNGFLKASIDTNGLTLPALSTAGILHNNSSGTISSGLVSLSSEITGILPIANGGTNISTSPSNGQLLIGNGTDYSLSTLTGTTNQVVVSNASGSITLSLPQNIATTSSPTFAGLTLTGLSGILKASAGSVSGSATTSDLAEGTTNLYYTNTRARSSLSAGTGISYNSGTGSISNSGVTSVQGTANQVLSSGSTGAIALSLPQSIATTSSPTFNALTLTNLSIGSLSGILKATAGSVSGSATTSDLAEGTNYYYTDSRSRAAISAGTGIGYDSSTGSISNSGVTSLSGTANQIISSGSTGAIALSLPQSIATTSSPTFNALTLTNLSIGSLSGILKATAGSVSGSATTSDLAEGTTNLYYTNTRARSSLSAGTGISYNSGTGSISNSGVTSLTGVTNQITCSASTGGVTLSLPQDLNTTSKPAFTNVLFGANVITSTGAQIVISTTSGQEYFISGTPCTIKMPPTGISTISPGQYWLISNTTSGSLTIYTSNGSTVILTQAINTTIKLTLINNTGSGLASEWEAIYIGFPSNNITGSGANVLATSPTLVTPILGTPQSGNLQNCTGLTAAGGGTGLSSYTTGDILYASSSSTLSKLGIGSSGNVLTSNGTGPVWSSSPTLTAPILGTPASGTLTNCTGLTAAGGGTGLTSYTTGDILYASSSSTLSKLALGATGTVIVSNGTTPVYSSSPYISGSIGINTGAPSLSDSSMTCSTANNNLPSTEIAGFLSPNLGLTNMSNIKFGRARSNWESGYVGFRSLGSGSSSNQAEIGLFNKNAVLTVDGTGQVAMQYYGGGSVTITGTGWISTSSDIRLKNSINYFTENSLSKILQLKPCNYKLNSDPYNTYEGFIAQDVEQVLPDCVDGKKYENQFLRDENNNIALDENGKPLTDPDTPRYRGVNQMSIIAHLVKAVQELTARVIALGG